MKRLNILLLLIFISVTANSQILQFDYDASGNCVLKYRTIVVAPELVPAKSQTDELGEIKLTIILTHSVFSLRAG